MLVPIEKYLKTRKDEYKPSTKDKLPSEVNFLVLPFFSLARKDVYQREGLEYRKKVRRNGKRQEIAWKVSASSDYGYPGPFDKRVYKAVEELVATRGFPIENPISFSIYELCKTMEVEDVGGRYYKEIKTSLQRLVATTIKSEGSFYLKGKKRYLDDVFHLFSRVVFSGEKLPNGQVAEENYLYLNPWLLDNLNQFYVRPLDYNFYKSLESQIARRLYELLGVKFFGLLEKEKPFLRYKYNTLCNLIPLTKQKYLSKAQQIIKPAHQELERKSFLSNVKWESINGKNRWYIYYHPGSRARAEIKDPSPK